MLLSSSDDHDHTIAAYIRIASIAVAAYDYLRTTPVVFSIYRNQFREGRITLSVASLALIRVVSVVAFTVSNVGFFYAGFTEESCKHYYQLSPSFKVIQLMVSEAILGMRIFNLSRRSWKVGIFLAALFTTSSILAALSTIWRRVPNFNATFGNCLPRSAIGSKTFFGTASYYYTFAIIYDVITTGLCIFFLVKYKFMSRNSTLMSSIANMMLVDGLVYFVALTAVNAVNVVFYRSISNPELQTAAASPGYLFIWIMTQKLLLHLHAKSLERRQESINGIVTLTHNLSSGRDISRAVRSQFDVFDITKPSVDILATQYPEPAVQVTIERTVTLQRNKRAYGLEDYSRSGQDHPNDYEDVECWGDSQERGRPKHDGRDQVRVGRESISVGESGRKKQVI